MPPQPPTAGEQPAHADPPPPYAPPRHNVFGLGQAGTRADASERGSSIPAFNRGFRLGPRPPVLARPQDETPEERAAGLRRDVDEMRELGFREEEIAGHWVYAGYQLDEMPQPRPPRESPDERGEHIEETYPNLADPWQAAALLADTQDAHAPAHDGAGTEAPDPNAAKQMPPPATTAHEAQTARVWHSGSAVAGPGHAVNPYLIPVAPKNNNRLDQPYGADHADAHARVNPAPSPAPERRSHATGFSDYRLAGSPPSARHRIPPEARRKRHRERAEMRGEMGRRASPIREDSRPVYPGPVLGQELPATAPQQNNAADKEVRNTRRGQYPSRNQLGSYAEGSAARQHERGTAGMPTDPADAPVRNFLPPGLAGYHVASGLNEVSEYMANANYVVSLGGAPLPWFKYGIVIVPAGREDLLLNFRRNPALQASEGVLGSVEEEAIPTIPEFRLAEAQQVRQMHEAITKRNNETWAFFRKKLNLPSDAIITEDHHREFSNLERIELRRQVGNRKRGRLDDSDQTKEGQDARGNALGETLPHKRRRTSGPQATLQHYVAPGFGPRSLGGGGGRHATDRPDVTSTPAGAAPGFGSRSLAGGGGHHATDCPDAVPTPIGATVQGAGEAECAPDEASPRADPVDPGPSATEGPPATRGISATGGPSVPEMPSATEEPSVPEGLLATEGPSTTRGA